ncbi:MAG: energy-coupled thiamine transporter ThiT, partial [Candidatus Xenobia bacterium]
FGGRISLDMIPILLLAFWEGPLAGVVCGMLYGYIDILIERVGFIHPMQVLIDYPLAFATLGLAGFARHCRPAVMAAAVVGVAALRLACHVTTGMIWFTHGQFGPSLTYNLGYMVPDTIVAAVLVPALVMALRRADA